MIRWPAPAVASLLLLAACPDDDAVDDDTDDTEPDTQVESDTEPPSEFEAVEAIFARSCTAALGCHDGPEVLTGLDLSPGNAYDQLVNVASTEVPGLDRVEPNDVETSFLWHKVAGTSSTVGDTTGESMPPPFGLGEADLAVIRTWIEAGAPR